MQITGTLQKVFPQVEYGKQGKKKATVLLTYGAFDKSKTIAFTVFEKAYETISSRDEGNEVTVEFDVESREWQGKYYTDAVAWKFTKGVATKDVKKETTKAVNEEFRVPDNKTWKDDLPFALFAFLSLGSMFI